MQLTIKIILLLLCLSSVYSGTVEKDRVEKLQDAEKSKRHVTQHEPCLPEHYNSQIWKPEIKQAINYVTPSSIGWQTKSSVWDQQKWQPISSGWQSKLSEQDQQKWQTMTSAWQQPNLKPMLTRWQQSKWQPMPIGGQPLSSGWEQQKLQIASTGWQPKSFGWDQKKWQSAHSLWQQKSSGWDQQKTQPASTDWQLKSSGWQQPKLQPISSAWQLHPSGWQSHSPNVNVHKPMFEYAPMYHQPMIYKSWSPSVKTPCPDPCKSLHDAVHYTSLPSIKIPQINYMKVQSHPPVNFPPVQNKVWEKPCD